MSDFERIRNIFDLQAANKKKINLSTVNSRKIKLKKLLSSILQNVDEITEAIYQDFNKSPTETKLSEIFPVTSELRHTIRNLKHWSKPQRVLPPLVFFNSTNKILYKAKGQVLIISPWNYPFLLALGPLISAIAAGNCVIIKPSEHTPNTSALLYRFIAQIFDENEISVVEGDYKESQFLLSLPFDHIFFTGSTRVGKIVMEAAAKNLASVTLELGGKSPTVIDESADLDNAVQKIVWGKYLNCGQTCVAPDYILLPEYLLNKFETAFKNSLNNIYGDINSIQLNTDYCRIVNDKQYERLISLLDDAVNYGAKLVGNVENNVEQKFLSPVLLTNVSLNSKIMNEEVFGPILPVITYKNEHEIFEIIVGNPKPLALYIFSKRKSFINKLLNTIPNGGAMINDVVIHFSNFKLPFGGVGSSGIGKGHGFTGFKTFSNETAVMKQPNIAPSRLLYPPYTKTVKKLIDVLIKYF